MNVTSRAAAGLADLEAAADVLTQAWLASAPFVDATPGDLWSAGERLVGWSWADEVELESQANDASEALYTSVGFRRRSVLRRYRRPSA